MSRRARRGKEWQTYMADIRGWREGGRYEEGGGYEGRGSELPAWEHSPWGAPLRAPCLLLQGAVFYISISIEFIRCMFSSRHLNTRVHPKTFLATKVIKIQDKNSDEKGQISTIGYKNLNEEAKFGL
jgi:hypothetical protein